MLSLSGRLIWPYDLGTEIAANHVAAQRQRQSRDILPPDAEVDETGAVPDSETSAGLRG